MNLFILAFFTSTHLIPTQNNQEETINNIHSDHLPNYGDVAPSMRRTEPQSCGKGLQKNKFVCVPYYNCNSKTNTVQTNPDFDGAGKIDVRLRDDSGEQHDCRHYLEVCCRLPDGDQDHTADDHQNRTNPSPTPSGRANCGVRNSQGLDFNLVGGTNEANFGEFPWMVAILRKNPYSGEHLAICGGSLIAPNVVLTGAHCIHNVNIGTIMVRAGEWDTQTQNERIPYQQLNVARKFVHELFNRGNLYHDVGLLILDGSFTKTDSVGTVCLPPQNQHFDSKACFASGWGKDTFGQRGKYAVILKKLQLPMVQNGPCEQALRRTRLGNSFILHQSFVCAGGQPDLDTCTGDGGSPLVCPDPANPGRYVQTGIVAWGIGCGTNQVPGVYVDVAHFRNWIDLRLQQVGIGVDSYTL